MIFSNYGIEIYQMWKDVWITKSEESDNNRRGNRW